MGLLCVLNVGRSLAQYSSALNTSNSLITRRNRLLTVKRVMIVLYVTLTFTNHKDSCHETVDSMVLNLRHNDVLGS